MPITFQISPSPGYTAKSTLGSDDKLAFGREPWTPPALEDVLPQLSLEERVRLQKHLREHERRVRKWNKTSPQLLTVSSPPLLTVYSEGRRDRFIIRHVRGALHHYNAKHPGEEFDVVKPLMESSAGFRGELWTHVNFWARSRQTKKIKRFFAEVHYRTPTPTSSIVPVSGAKKAPNSGSVCPDLPFPTPEAEKPSSISSICSDPPFPAPEAEKPSSSSSMCSDPPFPAPEAEKPSSSSLCFDLPILVPIVEVCTIIEEPLDRHRKSCAFCRGGLDILHPKVVSLSVGTTRTGCIKNSGRAGIERLRSHSLVTWTRPLPRPNGEQN